MQKYFYKNFLLIFLLSSVIAFGQLYQGPAQGSVPSGITHSTGSYMLGQPSENSGEKIVRNKINYIPEPMIIEGLTPNVEMTYFEDKVENIEGNNSMLPFLVQDFNGIPQTSSIPPDPYLAVGPNHVMGVVNSRFSIWDKEGNLLSSINADTWYGSLIPGVGSFDPKVLYDHFDKRWIMVWLDQSDNAQRGYFIVSVSQDSNATGTWYSWALPSNVNGTTNNGSWGDYQGVGIDQDAIYITANQFSFAGSFQYAKIRIVPKAQLYANNAGAVTFTDLWDIRYPTALGTRVFNIRPTIHYSESNEYYLLHANNQGSTFFVLYKIINPLNNPSMTAVNVPVSFYSPAPNANQLGGSTILIEGAGSALRFEPTYRDGFIWVTHTIRNPQFFSYSSARYVKIDVANAITVEDAAIGADGFWHIYTGIAVDKNGNAVLTYSRTGVTEYIGAYYTAIPNGTATFTGSKVLAAGRGNYVKDFGSGRNRWGDYNGIWLDPVNELDFWMMTEYVAATNTWGNHIGHVRVEGYQSPTIYTPKKRVEFGFVEKGFTETVPVFISNYGNPDLTISNINFSNPNFSLASSVTFPLTLSFVDTMTLFVTFNSDSVGEIVSQMNFVSNDPNFTGIELVAKGFEVLAANDNILYATSGTASSGNVITINKSTGAGAVLGTSNYNVVNAVAIHPNTKMIYAMISGATTASILRMNGLYGDAYLLFEVEVPNASGLAFDTSGVLYLGSRSGKIYNLNLETQSATEVVTLDLPIQNFVFDPENNEMYLTNYYAIGNNRDRLFKVDLSNGTYTLVGKSGFNLVTNGMIFDEEGTLYGVTGAGTTIGNLITLNKETGVGTLVGSIGHGSITDIAYIPGEPTNVRDEQINANIPADYNMSQNYPNPFNPVTVIEYSLPKNSFVELNVYNILGEKVAVLVNGMKDAGNYKVTWDVTSVKSQVSSGVYFYELKGEDVDKNNFSIMKKMILMK